MPSPNQVFDLDPSLNWREYHDVEEYFKHPSVANFQNEINWIWEGTKEELFHAAKNDTDLMFPDRKLCENDIDFKQLSALYKKIRSYLNKINRKKKAKTNKKH